MDENSNKNNSRLKREKIDIPGVNHNMPTPMGTKLGNIVFSSAIFGMDPNTNEIPSDLDVEIAMVFQNATTLIENAGGTTDNIGHMNFFVRTKDIRPKINEYWLKMFPDENNRPVRHVMKIEMPDGVNLQIEFIAVL